MAIWGTVRCGLIPAFCLAAVSSGAQHSVNSSWLVPEGEITLAAKKEEHNGSSVGVLSHESLLTLVLKSTFPEVKRVQGSLSPGGLAAHASSEPLNKSDLNLGSMEQKNTNTTQLSLHSPLLHRVGGQGAMHSNLKAHLSLGRHREVTRAMMIDVDGCVQALQDGTATSSSHEAGDSLVVLSEEQHPGTCSYAAGLGVGDHMPFVYWRYDEHGSRTYLAPEPDPGGSGLCLFPSASCAATRGDCCSISPWVNRSIHISDFLICAFAMVTTVPIMVLVQIWRSKNYERLETDFDRWDALNFSALYASIFVNINTSWLMARLTQLAMKVYDRNAMLAAGAFLTPFSDVFLFLEDAISVQIGYSVGALDRQGIALTLNVGVFGGLLLGALAASLSTALVSWSAAIETLVDPGRHAMTGCALVPSASAIVADAKAFWLLTSWSWPFAFASLALTGFLYGTRNYGIVLAATLLSKLVLFGVWFSSFQDLTGLAWANFTSTFTYFAVCVLGILVYAPLYRLYNLTSLWDLLSCLRRGGTAGVSLQDMIGDISRFASVLKQGLQAMLVDLSVQICISSGIYIASGMGVETLYQVSALQAALPLYIGCAGGIAYNMKLVVSVMVGLGLFRDIKGFVHLCLGMATIYAVSCIGSTAPFLAQLAFVYAPQACEFASDPACASTYRGIFGGGATAHGQLQETFQVLPVAAAVASFFSVVKAGLLGCFDFAFMARASVAVLLLVYAPAAAVTRAVFRSPAAICFAMYLPVCVLTVIFLVRLLRVGERIAKGEPGPWSSIETLGAEASIEGGKPSTPTV